MNIYKSVAILVTCALSSLLAAGPVRTSYTAYRFEPQENWQMRAQGDRGASALTGKRLIADFSQGAAWISFAPPDRVLLGNVDKLRLRVRGNASGHPLHWYLRTHFMTFHKVAGELAGAQEMVLDAPPGAGWQWSGGENDGKIHGPLRLGEIRIEANGRRDRVEMELVDIQVEGNAPPEKLTVMTADANAGSPKPVFRASIRTLSATPLAGTLSWRVRRWSGEEVSSGERGVSVAPGAEPLSVDIPGPAVPPGVKFLEAELRLSIQGQDIPSVMPCWIAPVESNADTRLDPGSPFGMGVYLGRFRGPDMDRVAGMARDAGVKWSREDIGWGRIEPQKGQYQWEFHDNLVATAKRNGISLYAILLGWAPWTKPYTQQGVDDYVAFLKVAVRRYKNDIRHWEIWNEPNIFFWDGPKDLYATLLAQSYAAIKEVDPSLQVLGISTAGIDYNFIARTMARGAPFDILTIHPYRKTLEDQIFINELSIVSDLVRLPDGRRRPVWITEMGWAGHTPHNTLSQDFVENSQRTRAELLARTYLCTLVSGIQPNTSWYNFRDDGDDPMYFEHTMGVLYRDFRPKPAYAAFATLARVMKEMKPAGKVDVPKGVFAHRFESASGKSVVALWSPEADAEASVPVSADRATLVNTIGETVELRVPASHRLGISLKKSAPVYLLMDR